MEFCSIVSAFVEKQYATAPVIQGLLLLEYDQPWGQEAWEEARIDSRVKQYLEEQIREKIYSRILLIRRPGSGDGSIRLFACNNREGHPFIRRQIVGTYEALLTIDFRDIFGIPVKENSIFPSAPARSGGNWEDFSSPLFLVCTNGRTDKCCSKFGLPIYSSLGRQGGEVWQSSHVTGDRFAPNVVHLPYCHYYGRLVPEEMTAFFDTVSRGSLYHRKYRGRSCYSQQDQAAEYFLREAHGLYGAEDLRLIESTGEEVPGQGGRKAVFYLPGPGRYIDVEIEMKLSENEYLLNCRQKKGRIKLFTLLQVQEKQP